MRVRTISYLFLISIIVAIAASLASATDPKISAESAILTDAATGQILWEKNARVRRPMASTTKIMTAIVVIENCKMTDVVTASKNATNTPYTSLNLRTGEQIEVKDMLYALLIRSANDAAVALAEHVAGSVEGFAETMNDKAKEIGANDTHFVTPNGLNAPGHYSTAYDLALITSYACRIPVFNEIVCTKSKRITRSINQEDLSIVAKSKFMKGYPGADGVKSGYIKEAGKCFVGSATRDGWRLISAVLNDPNTQEDTAALMEYGFNNYERLILADRRQSVQRIRITGGATALEVGPSSQVQVVVSKQKSSNHKIEILLDDLRAPVKKGEKVGTLVASVDGKQVCSVDLEATNDVNESIAAASWPWLRAAGLLAMMSLGVAFGRASTKGNGSRRSRFA